MTVLPGAAIKGERRTQVGAVGVQGKWSFGFGCLVGYEVLNTEGRSLLRVRFRANQGDSSTEYTANEFSKRRVIGVGSV